MILLLLAAGLGMAGTAAQNWSGNYPGCHRHQDLLNRGHVDLGVRVSTSNAALARQFGLAMDFWSHVLDLDWHEDDSQNCSLELVDGDPELFYSEDSCECISARAQFPNREAFEGWVAFNREVKLTESEMFLISVHEIGHLLGLPHNPNGSSVMFFFGPDGCVSLDAADLNALASLHRLRSGVVAKQVIAVAPTQ
jgi:Matrixin